MMMRSTLWKRSLFGSLIINLIVVGLVGVKIGTWTSVKKAPPVVEITFDAMQSLGDRTAGFDEKTRSSDSAINLDNLLEPARPITGYATSSMSKAKNGPTVLIDGDNAHGQQAGPPGENTTGNADKSAEKPNTSAASRSGSQGFTRPQLAYGVQPVYPETARNRGISGTVKVKMAVLADGTVSDCFVIASSGSRELDAAALETVRTWRFSPAVDKATGQPVPSYVTYPLVFTLE